MSFCHEFLHKNIFLNYYYQGFELYKPKGIQYVLILYVLKKHHNMQ